MDIPTRSSSVVPGAPLPLSVANPTVSSSIDVDLPTVPYSSLPPSRSKEKKTKDNDLHQELLPSASTFTSTDRASSSLSDHSTMKEIMYAIVRDIIVTGDSTSSFMMVVLRTMFFVSYIGGISLGLYFIIAGKTLDTSLPYCIALTENNPTTPIVMESFRFIMPPYFFYSVWTLFRCFSLPVGIFCVYLKLRYAVPHEPYKLPCCLQYLLVSTVLPATLGGIVTVTTFTWNSDNGCELSGSNQCVIPDSLDGPIIACDAPSVLGFSSMQPLYIGRWPIYWEIGNYGILLLMLIRNINWSEAWKDGFKKGLLLY